VHLLGAAESRRSAPGGRPPPVEQIQVPFAERIVDLGDYRGQGAAGVMAVVQADRIEDVAEDAALLNRAGAA